MFFQAYERTQMRNLDHLFYTINVCLNLNIPSKHMHMHMHITSPLLALIQINLIQYLPCSNSMLSQVCKDSINSISNCPYGGLVFLSNIYASFCVIFQKRNSLISFSISCSRYGYMTLDAIITSFVSIFYFTLLWNWFEISLSLKNNRT